MGTNSFVNLPTVGVGYAATQEPSAMYTLFSVLVAGINIRVCRHSQNSASRLPPGSASSGTATFCAPPGAVPAATIPCPYHTTAALARV